MLTETQAAFARRIGVSKQAVADYLKRGKIDGAAVLREGQAVRIDVDKALTQLRKRLDPDQRISLNARANLRKPPEPPLVATAEQFWGVLREMPSTAAWEAAAAGATLQQAFDVHAGLALNVVGLLRSYYGAAAPGEVEPVDWQALADAYDLGVPDLGALAAEWDRRRAAD